MSLSIIRYLLRPPYRKHRKHSTVQHSAVNPRNKQQSKYAIRARLRRNADGVGSRQHVVGYIYSSLCSHNERRNRNLVGLQKYCWWCEQCCFSPPYAFRPYMRRAGCFRRTWSSWHLQVADLHPKPWTSLCDSVIRIVQYTAYKGNILRTNLPVRKILCYQNMYNQRSTVCIYLLCIPGILQQSEYMSVYVYYQYVVS